MPHIASFNELLVSQMRDLYDAEKRLTKAIPKLGKAAANDELRAALEHHLEGDPEQEQPARDHQSGDGDMQIVEDLLAEQSEDGDHAEGDRDRLERHAALDPGGAAGGEGQEDRGDSGRVHDHK